jgi:plasmid stabilization system protein ParE
MSRLIWSRSALGDVQPLHRFLVSKNPDAARRSIVAIRRGVRILAALPASGRPVEDMEVEYRELVIEFGDSGYVVLYRYDGATAVILAVRHQKEAGY